MRTLDRDYTNEMRIVGANLIHFYNYLKKNGVNVYICGEQSFIDRRIPRVDLNN